MQLAQLQRTANQRGSVELSCVAIDTSPTQLNSTRRRVELSLVELCRYKRAFSYSHLLQRDATRWNTVLMPYSRVLFGMTLSDLERNIQWLAKYIARPICDSWTSSCRCTRHRCSCSDRLIAPSLTTLIHPACYVDERTALAWLTSREFRVSRSTRHATHHTSMNTNLLSVLQQRQHGITRRVINEDDMAEW